MSWITTRHVVAVAASTSILGVGGAAPAWAQDVRLTARDGVRVKVAVPSTLRGQPLRLTVDGRRKTLVRRPATFSVNGLAWPDARWHTLRLHGRRHSVTARFAVGMRDGRHSPTLVLTQAPARQAASTLARFRYSASGGRIRCSVDGAPVSCRRTTATVTAGPGRHVFAVRARRGRSVTSVSWAWTVTSAASVIPSDGDGPPTPAAPSTPAPAAPAAPGGAPGGGGGGAPSGWRLIMSDGFDGPTLNASLWRMYGPNWPGHAGNGIRDTSAVSVSGGVLTITAQMAGGTLISGAVASRVSTTYGRVEFRARVDGDPSQATSGVVLMWPDSDNWPLDGETDIFESGTGAARDSFTSAVHYGASNQQVWFRHAADARQWQNMAMEWTPTSIRFYRNGALEGEVTDPAAIARASQHLCVQLDAFSSTMSGVVRLQVDDVRMYALS